MSVKVRKETAVAICRDFGFATADGWSDEKLVNKLGKLLQIHRSGEFELKDESLADELARLARGDEDDELEIVKGDDEDFEDEEEEVEEEVGGGESGQEEEDEDEFPVEGCSVQVGDRGLVHEAGEDAWKGIVTQVFSKDLVKVCDRKGKSWHVRPESFEVKLRASEAKPNNVVKPERPKREPKPPKDEQEAEIRSLQERIRALKSKRRKTNGGEKKPKAKKFRRDEIAVHVLRSHPEGGILEHLAEEVESRWTKQGRQENLKASTLTLRRLVKAGVLFGLLKMDGRKVMWTDSK